MLRKTLTLSRSLVLNADDRTNRIVATGDEESLATVGAMLGNFDLPAQDGPSTVRTMIYPLKYAKADETVKALAGVAKQGGVSSVVADNRTNSLIVIAQGDKQQDIAHLLANIDRPAH